LHASRAEYSIAEAPRLTNFDATRIILKNYIVLTTSDTKQKSSKLTLTGLLIKIKNATSNHVDSTDNVCKRALLLKTLKGDSWGKLSS